MTGKAVWMVLLAVSIFLILALAVIFLLPVPYTATEVYTVQEQYTSTESYTDTEPYVATEYYDDEVPITVEECRADISANPMDYVNRGIDNIGALLSGDLSKLIQTCENVIQYRTETKSRDIIRYRTVEKQRPITKYRDVQRERMVTKKATPYMFWTNQVQYRYTV